MKKLYTLLIVIYCINVQACTIGVAIGKATADGRSLLWKTRDYEVKNNIVFYTQTDKYSFISNITPEYGYSKSWSGVNEKGFAIVNTDIKEFPDGIRGPDNGDFINEALKYCASVQDFQNLLDSTNQTGRNTKAIFGVIDAKGGAAIFEVNAIKYWKFDANDKSVAPEGFIVKTNFTSSSSGTHGIERYKRSSDLIHDFYKGDSLTVKNILQYEMRDLADPSGKPIINHNSSENSDVSTGTINCSKNICTPYSISATVIQGILPNEPDDLTTMWTMLGNPFTSITVPYWPIGETPSVSVSGSGYSLYGISARLKKWVFNQTDKKIANIERILIVRHQLLQAEDSIYTATISILRDWQKDHPSKGIILDTEKRFAEYAYSKMLQTYHSIISAGNKY